MPKSIKKVKCTCKIGNICDVTKKPHSNKCFLQVVIELLSLNLDELQSFSEQENKLIA